MPPLVERLYVRESEYAGGFSGVDGWVRELRVIRSVTIYDGTSVTGRKADGRAHPLIESFALADKDSIPFDEVRIKRLREREDHVPELKDSF